MKSFVAGVSGILSSLSDSAADVSMAVPGAGSAAPG